MNAPRRPRLESIVPLLKRVQEQAGLSRKDGPPLYAYRVDDGTLDALKLTLRVALRNSGSLDGLVCAGICLFAAEHLCRHYEAGAWRWQEVIEALGFDRGYSELQRVIQRGLNYWGRPLLTLDTQRRFLGTLMCEGGLPRSLLQRDEQAVTRFLRELLSDRERYANTPTEELADRHASGLPKTLRNDTVRELGCRLVDELARLRARVPGEADVATLDACETGWRLRLPLRLDDDAADRLLGGLLRAPRAAMSRNQAGIRMEVRLREAPMRIVRRVRMSPEMEPAALADMLDGVSEDALPSRLRLWVHGTDGSMQEVGVATRFADTYRLHVLHRRATVVESPARLTLVATEGTREVGRGELDGGDELSAALPWVFTDEDGASAQTLVGVGTVYTRREQVRILVPESADWEVDDDAAEDELGAIVEPAGRVVRLCGGARVRVDGECYRVRTQAPDDSERRYMLRGRHGPLGAGVGGSDVWYGMPRLLSVTGEEPPTPVPVSQVQWRDAGAAGAWRQGGRPVGDVVIRVVEDGDTRFRARVSVVPTGLRCRLLAGHAAGDGCIRLTGTGARDLRCEADEAMSARVEVCGPGAFDVHVSAGAYPPALIGLGLLFHGGNEARLNVPFPSPVPVFVDGTGQPLRDGAELSLRELVGAYAEVRAPRPQSQFLLSGRLNQGGPGWIDLATFRSQEGGHVGISLDALRGRIENLLTSSAALDATETLQLEETGGTRPVRLVVRHYDAALEPSITHANGGRVARLALNDAGRAALGEMRLAALRVEAWPLARPTEPREAVPCAADDGWEFELRGRRPGGWLITGRVESLMMLRPLLITVRADDQPEAGAGDGACTSDWADDDTPLLRAVRIDKRQERKLALDEVIAALSEDFDHPDWANLLRYLDELQTLPASAFDPVQALRRQPAAAVMALFLVGAEERFRAIWNGLEDLPFLWTLVPVRAWVQAARRLRDHMRAVTPEGLGLDPEALARERIMQTMAWAAQRALHLGWLPLAAPELFGEGTAPSVLHKPQYDAVLRHAGQWPRWRHGESLQALLDACEVPESCRYHNEYDERHAVLNAPVLAATAAIVGHSFEKEIVFELRRMRIFNEDWFAHAHAHAFRELLNARLMRDPEYLQ